MCIVMNTSSNRAKKNNQRHMSESGGMAELIRFFDWSRTPLGPREHWPVSLQTIVETLVACRFPIALLWGQDLILIYNDAYAVICADKHPGALGCSTREVWPEVWRFNRPIFEAVMERGETLYFEDKLFAISRNRFNENAFFTLCYSPVRIEDGSIGGTLVVLQETTGRMQAKAELESTHNALIESEADLAEAQRVAKIGNWSFDILQNKVLWSEEVYRIFEIEKGKFSGLYESFLNRIHPDDQAAVRQVNIQARANGGSFKTEYRILTPNNELKDIREVGYAKKDAEGTVVRLFGTVQDITEHKQAEEALHDSEERYRTVVEDQTEVICRFKSDGRFTFANNVFCRFFGKKNDELIGKQWQPIFLPEDLPLVERELCALAPSRPVVVIENRVRSGRGEIRWIQFVNRGFFDADGRLVEIQSVGRDITDHKQVEEALRESEARYRCLYATCMDAVLLTAPDGRIFSANAAACQMFGRTESEIIQAGRDGLVDVTDPQLQYLLGHRESTGKVMGELRMLRRDGTPFLTEISSSVFTDIHGELRTSMIIRDTTERKQIEKMAEVFAHRLLTAREEERKQISAVLHHDLGSLTVGLAAHLNVMEEEVRSCRCDVALQEVKQVRKLIDQTVNRLKQVAIQIRPPELDVIGLCAALQQHFAGVIKQGRVRIRFRETLGRKYFVLGETATILFRVAQEALTNALTHGRAKRVDVSLGASKGQVRLTVRDYGKGFDPSDSGVMTTTQMGLLVMREMTTAAGGMFHVDSKPGHGAIVRAGLPLPVAMTAPITEQSPAARSKTRGARRKRRSSA
jgi:two-component system, NarL family, sensor histidine kinase UhpB